jgi:hypothetical protein
MSIPAQAHKSTLRLVTDNCETGDDELIYTNVTTTFDKETNFEALHEFTDRTALW